MNINWQRTFYYIFSFFMQNQTARVFLGIAVILIGLAIFANLSM